jgi:hypothetical protein
MVARRTTLNSDASWPTLIVANARVLDHQRKLHRWSKAPARRFDAASSCVTQYRATSLERGA